MYHPPRSDTEENDPEFHSFVNQQSAAGLTVYTLQRLQEIVSRNP
jgi:hypothetical protein